MKITLEEERLKGKQMSELPKEIYELHLEIGNLKEELRKIQSKANEKDEKIEALKLEVQNVKKEHDSDSFATNG